MADFFLELPGGVKPTVPAAADGYYRPTGSNGYASVAAACAGVPEAVRIGRTVLVAGVEYAWGTNVSDAGLQLKAGSGGSTPIATATTVGTVKPGTGLTVTADGTLNAAATSDGGVSQAYVDAGDLAAKNRANHTGTQSINTVTGLQGALDGKAPTTHTHTAAQVTGLATVATSGSYNDLTDKPTSTGTGGGVSNGKQLSDYSVTQDGAQQIPVPTDAIGGLALVLVRPAAGGTQTEKIIDPAHYRGAPVNNLLALSVDAGAKAGDVIKGFYLVEAGTGTGGGDVTKAYVDSQDRKKVEFYQPGRPAYADVLYYGTGFAGTGLYKPKNDIGTSNVLTTQLFTFESADTVDFNQLTPAVREKLGLSGNLQPYYVTSFDPPRAYSNFDEAVEDEDGASILIFTPGTESYTNHLNAVKNLVGIGITPNVEIYGQFNRPAIIQNINFGVYGPPCELDGSAKFVGGSSQGAYYLTSNGIELRNKHKAEWGVITAATGFDIHVFVEAGSTITYTSKPANVYFDFEASTGGSAGVLYDAYYLASQSGAQPPIFQADAKKFFEVSVGGEVLTRGVDYTDTYDETGGTLTILSAADVVAGDPVQYNWLTSGVSAGNGQAITENTANFFTPPAEYADLFGTLPLSIRQTVLKLAADMAFTPILSGAVSEGVPPYDLLTQDAYNRYALTRSGGGSDGDGGPEPTPTYILVGDSRYNTSADGSAVLPLLQVAVPGVNFLKVATNGQGVGPTSTPGAPPNGLSEIESLIFPLIDQAKSEGRRVAVCLEHGINDLSYQVREGKTAQQIADTIWGYWQSYHAQVVGRGAIAVHSSPFVGVGVELPEAQQVTMEQARLLLCTRLRNEYSSLGVSILSDVASDYQLNDFTDADSTAIFLDRLHVSSNGKQVAQVPIEARAATAFLNRQTGIIASTRVQPETNPIEYRFGDPGTAQNISVANPGPLNLNTGFTIGGWVTLTSIGDTFVCGRSVSGSQNAIMCLAEHTTADQVRRLQLILRGSNGSFLFAYLEFPPSGRHWLTYSWDGTSNANAVKIYVDGVLGSTMVTGGSWQGLAAGGAFSIGALPGENKQSINTYVDTLYVANRALTQAEVTESYNNGARANMAGVSFAPSLLAEWRFQGDLLDSVGDHHGTATTPLYRPL